MDAIKIEGANLVLGAPSDWDADKDGECGALHAFRESGGPITVTTSAWKPTPEELSALMNGGSVYLTVWGQVHPPVCIWVPDHAVPLS